MNTYFSNCKCINSSKNHYILARHTCTHLELEKLGYMCYADYLCRTGKKLFKDTVYAFKYGPVVESVYEKYKGTKEIEDNTNKTSFRKP